MKKLIIILLLIGCSKQEVTYKDRLKTWAYNHCYHWAVPDSLLPVTAEDSVIYNNYLNFVLGGEE